VNVTLSEPTSLPVWVHRHPRDRLVPCRV